MIGLTASDTVMTVLGLAGVDQYVGGWNRATGAMRNFESQQASLASRATTATGIGLTTAITGPLIAAIGYATKLGVESVESENLVKESFGGMLDAAERWSKGLSEQLGLNEYQLRKNAGIFHVMFQAMGIGEQKSFEMSTGLTKLTEDMTSFFNIAGGSQEAFQQLRAALTGEVEVLRRYGVVIDDVMLKQWAQKNGMASQATELTQAQKVWIRYNLILEQTKKAQGDLGRTLESPANKMRRMRTQFDAAMTKFGVAMIPLLEDALKLLDKVEPKVSALVKWFSGLSKGAKAWALGLTLGFGPLLIIVGKLLGFLSNLKNVTGKVPGMGGGGAFGGGTAGVVNITAGVVNVAGGMGIPTSGIPAHGGNPAYGNATRKLGEAGAGAGAAGAGGAAGGVAAWLKWLGVAALGVGVGVGGYEVLRRTGKIKNAPDSTLDAIGNTGRRAWDIGKMVGSIPGWALSGGDKTQIKGWDWERGQFSSDTRKQWEDASQKYQSDMEGVRKFYTEQVQKGAMTKKEADRAMLEKTVAIEKHWSREYARNNNLVGFNIHNKKRLEAIEALKQLDQKVSDGSMDAANAVAAAWNSSTVSPALRKRHLSQLSKGLNALVKSGVMTKEQAEKEMAAMTAQYDKTHSLEKKKAPEQQAWDARTARVAALFGLGPTGDDNVENGGLVNMVRGRAQNNEDDSTTLTATLPARQADKQYRRLVFETRTPQPA